MTFVGISSPDRGGAVGFAVDSSLEGDGFELPVPGALGEAARARQGEITDPLPRSSLSRTAIRQLPVLASNPKNLNRSTKRQDVQLFFFLSLPVAGGPNGGGFLVNGHDVDVRRNYSVASTCHTGVDNAPEWKLEHDIARSEA